MSVSVQPSFKKFSTIYCDGTINNAYVNEKYDINVSGVIHDTIKDDILYYLAANPLDRRASFTGSGLPFANSEQAFEGTSNRGHVKSKLGSFNIPLLFPNSFYADLGNVIIPPSLFLKWYTLSGEEKRTTIKLGDPIPYRFLSYPKEYTMSRDSATFYHAHHNLPVRTQEQVLRDSVYPSVNKMYSDYWGLKPAL
jgi:hypothetical protein